MTHAFDDTTAFRRKLRFAHLCANLSYAALLGVLSLALLTREDGFSLVLWCLACLPLLILWPAMRRRHYRAYSWLCFVVLLYFIQSVVGTMAPNASWADVSLLVLSVTLFISAMFTSRWLQRSSLSATHNSEDKETP